MVSAIDYQLAGIARYFQPPSPQRQSILFGRPSFGPATILDPGGRDVQTVLDGVRFRSWSANSLRDLQDSASFAAAAAVASGVTEQRVGFTPSTVEFRTSVVTTTQNYSLDVANLASAQSATIASSNSATLSLDNSLSSTGELQIQFGSYDAGTNVFTASGAVATVTVGGVGSLQDIADAVNGANAGVTASVVLNGATYDLKLTSTTTGKASAFRVAVTRDDIDGHLTNGRGLSKVRFDPTTATGYQVARDASFTVDGVAGASAGNTGVEIAPGVTTDLTTTGAQTVTIQASTSSVASVLAHTATTITLVTGPDLPLLTSAAYGLAGNLNAFLDQLERLGDGDDRRIAGFRQSVDQALRQRLATGNAAIAGLADIGFSRGADGSIAVDADKLASAAAEDAAAVAAVLREGSKAVATAAEDLLAGLERVPAEGDAAFLGYALKDATVEARSQLRAAEEADQLANVITAMIVRRAEEDLESRERSGDKDREKDEAGRRRGLEDDDGPWIKVAAPAAG